MLLAPIPEKRPLFPPSEHPDPDCTRMARCFLTTWSEGLGRLTGLGCILLIRRLQLIRVCEHTSRFFSLQCIGILFSSETSPPFIVVSPD